MFDLAIGNNMTDPSLSVLVQKCGEKFIWELAVTACRKQ
jgi:hypothetical protein